MSKTGSVNLPEEDYRWSPGPLNSYGYFAEYYDELGWIRFTNYTFRKLKELINKFKITPKEIIDFGCGTGELLLRLSKLGFTGAGVDFSPGMINRAEKKLKDLEFDLFTADICSADLSREFPLAACFFDTVNHISTRRQTKKFLKNARKHVSAGGMFVFDFLTPEGVKDWEGTEVTSNEDHFILQQGKFIKEKGKALVTIEGFVKQADGKYRRFQQFLEHNGITVEEMAQYLNDAGFEHFSMQGFYHDWELDHGGRILTVACK